MDYVELTADRIKRKFKEITGSEEWKNADFLGKIEIVWDEMIAKPFLDWWNVDGKLMLTEAVQGIGNILGSGASPVCKLVRAAYNRDIRFNDRLM